MLSRRRLLWALAAGASLSARGQAPTNPPDRAATSAPAGASNAIPAPTIALILPGPQTPYARAAEAVREGFVAAQAAASTPVAIEVVEIEDSPANAVDALAAARARGVRLVVGPLTRAAVNAVAGNGDAGVPTLLLNLPDQSAAMAASQLAFGLAVEEEAAILVHSSLREIEPGSTPAGGRRHVVVVGESALARRIAAACVAALRAAGEPVVTLEYAQHGAAGIAREIGKAPVTSIFFALDIDEAVQVRTRLPIDAPVFATSRLNPVASGTAVAAIDLEGVHFLDMPWLVDPERPAFKVYRRAETNYSAEMQRLYALGIDAYRIAIEWLNGRTRFELDGVTGWLRVDRERGGRVERMPVFAVFREGRVERSDVLREQR